MKNTVYQGLAFLAMMLSLAACQKSGPASNETGENGASVSKKRISITATIPETITKVAMTQEKDNDSGKPTGPVSLAWETGDKITISNGPDTQEFELTRIEGTKAVFEGYEITGSSFTITYSKLPVPDFKRQTQPENASTEDLGWEGKLSGVNAITDFTFSSDWATAHGGTFTQSSILRLRAKLPEGVAPTIDCVTIKAFDTVTGEKVNLINDNIPQIAVAITTPGKGAEDDVVTVYATMPAENITIPKDKALLFSFSSTNTAHSVYTHYRPITSPITIAQGTVTPLNINCPNIESYANKTKDQIGTAENPYLIGDKYQMAYLRDLYKNAEDANSTVKYFVKMVDDVDMTGVSWTPLNRGGSYLRAIDFDGNGKRILKFSAGSSTDYPSFAGVLVGDLRNVIFESPSINAGDHKAGVVAGYIGTGSNIGNCSGVTIIDATVQGTQFIGAFAGQVNATGRIDDCHVLGNTTVTQNYATNAGRSTGGFVGNVSAAAVFTNCSVKATVTSPKAAIKGVGGFLGLNQTAGAIFKNCEVLSGSSVSSSGNWCGGFVGYAQAAGTYGEDGKPCTTAATVNGTGQYTGGFAGYIGNGNTFAYCNASGKVEGQKSTGGFGGKIDGANVTLENCSASGNVSGLQSIGGFAGEDTGNITYVNCASSGDVDGSGQDVAGFCGLVGGEGTVAFTGRFENCNVYNESKNITIKGGGQSIGGFVGWVGHNTLENNIGTLEKCYVKNVTISAHTTDCGPYVGGFAGVLKTKVSKCWTEGITIDANRNAVGGFVGYYQYPTISDCYAKGVNITVKNNNVGGFVGRLRAGTIEKCYAEGSVSATSAPYGGFVGNNQGTVSKSISWNPSIPFNGDASVTDCYTQAASETGTVSDHAQESPRSWDSSIWDFSTAFPTLK